MSAAEVNLFLAQVFPQIDIERLIQSRNAARLREDAHGLSGPLLRPGGTISGPAMFRSPMLRCTRRTWRPSDLAHAVTTDVTINFLRKPEQRDMLGGAPPVKAREAARSRRNSALFEGRDGLRRTPRQRVPASSLRYHDSEFVVL